MESENVPRKMWELKWNFEQKLNIIILQEENSSMSRFVDGRMLPICLPTSPIKEEKLELERLIKGHENILKNMDKTPGDLYHIL